MNEDGSLKIGEKISPFNPTHDKVISEVHNLLFNKENVASPASAIVYDLGCGDGRVLVSIARRPDVARVVGIEYDSKFVDRARQAAQTAQDSKGDHFANIEIRHADARQESASDATHIFCYLTPTGIEAVRYISLFPLLQRRGRLVTYVFSIPDLQPTRIWTWGAVSLYLYTYESLRNDLT